MANLIKAAPPKLFQSNLLSKHILITKSTCILSNLDSNQLTLLCTVHFAIELSDLSKPFKFARLKGFERLENCLTKGTYERF